jgi:toxin CptA
MKPLHINFKPSQRLTSILVMMSMTMCAILISLPLPWQIKLFIVILVVIMTSYAVALSSLLILPWSCVALRVNIKNELEIICRDGSKYSDVLICNDTVVTPYLVVIRYQQKNVPFLQRVFKASMIVTKDSTDAESFRRLRVWLRWGIH